MDRKIKPQYFILRWSTAWSGRWGLRGKERIFGLNWSVGVEVAGSLCMEGKPFLMRPGGARWMTWDHGSNEQLCLDVLGGGAPGTGHTGSLLLPGTPWWPKRQPQRSSSPLFVYQGNNQPHSIFPTRNTSQLKREETANETSFASVLHFIQVTGKKLHWSVYKNGITLWAHTYNMAHIHWARRGLANLQAVAESFL